MGRISKEGRGPTMGGFRINTNIPSLFGQRILGQTREAQQNQLRQIASGLRINQAADDAAGLAIGSRLDSQVRGIEQAQRNIQDGISAVQVAEGGVSAINDSLQRIRELSVQAANGTLSDEDRGAIQEEIDQLVSEVDRQAGATQFNGRQLLSGDQITIQSGAAEGETIEVTTGEISADTLGLTGLDVSTQAAAQNAISTVDTAINDVSGYRADLGAVQNRLEEAFNFTGIARENMLAAQSQIMDLDFGAGITNMINTQIREQAGLSALTQSNLSQRNVLGLLGG